MKQPSRFPTQDIINAGYEALLSIPIKKIEDFNSVIGYDYKAGRKETYILMVGACLSYNFYNEKKITEAKNSFDEVFKTILFQYRTSLSFGVKEYAFVFRFLAHIIANFASVHMDNFINEIDEKLDDIESLLVLAHEAAWVLKDASSSKMSVTSAMLIRTEIDNNFWKIEYRYKDHMLKHVMDYYLKLKENLLSLLS